MLDRLAEIERRYEELERLVADPTVIANRREFAKLARERAQLEETVTCWRERRRVARDLDEHRALLREKDAELRELARSELPALEARLAELDATLKHLLLPKDPNDERNTVLEIRAGTGGDEASLFAAELFRMYTRYAERHGWRVEVLSSSPTGLGGFKEVIALVVGKGAFSRLKFEGGVHRVQRVPVTETQGRIHTSAVTVAVLPEAEDVEVELADKDLRIDVYRSSGPAGQCVNTTDSAARGPHLPTGLGGAIAQLAAAEVAEPRADAEVLLAHALGTTRTALIASARQPLAPAAAERFAMLVARRAGREPVHYIVGEREFWSLLFAVDGR